MYYHLSDKNEYTYYSYDRFFKFEKQKLYLLNVNNQHSFNGQNRIIFKPHKHT